MLGIKHPLILATILFSGCSQDPADEEEAGGIDNVVVPAPSGAPPPQSLAGQYPVLRAAALQAARAEMDDSGEPPYLLREDSFDVIDCLGDDRNPELRPPPGKAGLVESTARQIAFLDLNFSRSGYSPEVYGGPLRDFEAWMLKSILEGGAAGSDASPSIEDRDALSRLAAQVESNRAELQPNLPKVVALGECGAGESDFIFKLQPVDGKAWVVNRFGFEVCKAKGLDPWDRDRCKRWDEVDPDRPMALAGTYVYQARWRNGAVGRGTKRLEPGDGETAAVVTIRPD
ncbi:MAG TPA: hypothetical protein VEW26_10430 [Allosphingosinicella sp.]|nr:hypothetical protein [Allosphingosinicella sp.]